MEVKPIIGLCLSGGGARGTAHVGVLKALEENGIVVEYISGASAGSIVGAMHAAGLTIEQQMECVLSSSLLKTFSIALPNQGLTDLSYLKTHLSKYIPFKNFRELYKGLFIAVSNLNTGKLEMIEDGPLMDAIAASCSVPLIFKPVEMNGSLYVDGGVLSNLPVKPLLPYVDKVIGVNVMPMIPEEKKNLESYFGIGFRTIQMGLYANSTQSYELCDVVIEPKELYNYKPFDFNQFEKMFEIGYNAAMAQMDEIKKLVE